MRRNIKKVKVDNEIVTVISILSVDLTCYLVLPTNNNNNYNNDSS